MAMLRTAALAAALVGLTACAGFEPSGRGVDNDVSAPAAAPQLVPPPPTQTAPTQAAPTQPPAAQPTGPVVTTPTPAPTTPPPVRTSGGEDVVVPGVRERQVPPPGGDPRSTSERMADIRAWDDCVMRSQGRAESDPMRPQLDTPEDVCRERLGMSSRTSVPDSRRD